MARTEGKSHQQTLIRRPLDSCPECGSVELEPIVDLDAEEVHFLCDTCNRCWHVELGYVRRVQPGACHGCPQTDQCTAVYAADHASG